MKNISKGYVIGKVINVILVFTFAIGSLIAAYHGNMEMAIYMAIWGAWTELLGIMRDIQRKLDPSETE